MVLNLIQLNGLDLESLKRIFSKNLRLQMDATGLTGSKLADDLGVSQGMVSKWINGLSFPDTVTIDKMRQTYGWKVSNLFKENDSPPPLDSGLAIKAIAEALGYERPRLKKRL